MELLKQIYSIIEAKASSFYKICHYFFQLSNLSKNLMS